MIPVVNIHISATSHKLMANWEDLDCVDHYVMRLDKVGPLHIMEYGIGNSQDKYKFYLDILADDDEDYAYDGQGSGSGEYSTTRPKR